MVARLTSREALVGLAMVTVGLGFFAASFGIAVQDQGGVAPRVFPMVGAMLIAALGVLQITLKSLSPGLDPGPQPKGEAEVPGQARDLLHLIGLLVLSMAYVMGITYFGYLVSTAVAAPVVLFLFGVRSLPGLGVSVVLCPAIYHLIFFVGLGVFPPYGLWFDLLDVIQGY